MAALYDAILRHASKLEKEESLFFLLEQLLQEYAEPFSEETISRPNPQIQSLCTYMEEHFSDNRSLDELTAMTTFGKSYLLRSFTKQIGVSPYRYLQTIRLDKAKHFLEQGIAPVDAAAMAGFSDPVSYTHLDVYKRQPAHRALGISQVVVAEISLSGLNLPNQFLGINPYILHEGAPFQASFGYL